MHRLSVVVVLGALVASCSGKTTGGVQTPATTATTICDRSGSCYPLQIPASPTCYSPCRAGVTRTDGTYAQCDADGLLEGCLSGTHCDQGSCVTGAAARASLPGAIAAATTGYPACAQDLDCPDFQGCIQGRCYAYCSGSGQCPGKELQCFRHACRLPCNASTSPCPGGQYCRTNDGTNGFCVPLGPASDTTTQVIGTFTVTPTSAALSNIATGTSITIRNDAPVALDFTVRKVSHREYSSTGFTTVTTSPLAWLWMGPHGKATQVQQLDVLVDGNGGEVVVDLSHATNTALGRWDGTVVVTNDKLGGRDVELSYATRPEGQWSGQLYYFANFPDGGLDAWLANPSTISGVGNALIQQWQRFKNGDLSYREWQAVMQATQTGSWRWASMRKYCPDSNTACYLFDNPQGFNTYSSSLLQYPVPTGVTELPLSVNLASDPADATAFVGRIVTSSALQDPGDPALRLVLSADPASCDTSTGDTNAICPLKSLDASIWVGGRYYTDPSDTTCALAGSGFTLLRTPWLVPGFVDGTSVDAATGVRYVYECRDGTLPFGAASQAANASFSAANPIPDGRTRRRTLSLVDGVMVNQDTLLVIFREHFDSFLGSTDTAGFSAYGLLTLRRVVADLAATDFVGNAPSDTRPPPAGVLGVTCDPDLLNAAIGSTAFPSDATGVDNLARTLLDGYPAGVASTPLDPAKVHYFCEDTGLLDGGAHDDGTAQASSIACPSESRVQYFAVGDLTQAQIAALPCQQAFTASSSGQVITRGNCNQDLNAWSQNGLHTLLLDPIWRCKNTAQAYCSVDRLDLRDGKDFFAPGTPAAKFLGLRAFVDDAFRYKTRFRNRTGQSVGFAPEICVPNSDQIPYCYSPDDIEAAKKRVDCILSIYTNQMTQLAAATTRPAVRDYLRLNFAYEQENVPGLPLPLTRDGFERLYAELVIMMGDESYTRAFASRFDLAGSSLLSFEGSAFEPNGINIGGGAGYEMYNLYQATQYYQAALDRFYALSPLLWHSIDTLGPDDVYITANSVVSYFDRLIRASAQKSRAFSEIATKYQGFNRPDLARAVIQRAYSATYVESIVLSRMMLKLQQVVLPEDRPQIVERVENAQNTYRSALLKMAEGFQGITDDPSLFGFSPDYIPFPALEAGDNNAFEKLFAAAQQKADTAGAKEEIALASSRAFDTDAAAFQSELVQIRNNYEGQLAAICGTFNTSDGTVYPAIPKYADQQPKLAQLGDPCGLVDNGDLYTARLDTDVQLAKLEDARQRYADVFTRMENEKQRVAEFCAMNEADLDYTETIGHEVDGLEAMQAAGEIGLRAADAMLKDAAVQADLKKCTFIVGTATGGDCDKALIGTAIYTASAAAAHHLAELSIAGVLAAKAGIAALQGKLGKWNLQRKCDYAESEASFKMRDILLDLKHVDLDVYQATIEVDQAMGRALALRNQATRLMSEQSETEQLSINVEAAKDDPNVRIYKNDAILTADRTFQDAVRAAYRATKVYEYYTSQSYANLGDLFLVRMVSHGDITLESYLSSLSEAFFTFQETFGTPDVRVAVLSLRDDLLGVARVGATGQPLSESDRITQLRNTLKQPTWLDANGYLTIPFSTDLAELSPVTRNHKVVGLEAEIVGSDVGDTLGRIYVRQRGTGTVRSVGGDDLFFLFPERTAVVNTFFNGTRVYDTSVYRSNNLRDRPFVNTHWELVLNQKDEAVNKDINLDSLTDVRLYVYYTDFTQLGGTP